ncbi:hypothetical protein [Nonomuraea lactucae]|uniref:hypothetical protein n=1 Tax=Nonomuraea lactucae TaxID=2249762 RepID=UPI000DE2191F|nr:hypothetical protein [Nonomuraea lactucae]
MKVSSLARRAAAFGASAAVLAGMVGLVASPAQAATATAGTAAAATTTSTGRPKVSVTTPKPSTRDYEGSCPAKVSFSAKIKVKLNGKAKVSYRWLHGDGSASKVKSVWLKGKGTKYVKATQSNTFGEDTKGWEALQVLSPRKVTSKKGYFSVDCASSPTVIDEDQLTKRARVSARAWASPESYVGPCTPGDKIDFNGVIRVSEPSWVKYRWILNGEVVDYGKTKVWHQKRVGFGISPRENQRGYAVLEVLRPDRTYSNRAYYKVWCKDEAPDSRVSVSGLVTSTNNDGCKVGARADIHSNGRGRVEWVWKVNGESVLRGDTWFRHGGTRNVSLSEQALSGAATRGGRITLTVFGPRNSDSITQSYSACQSPRPTVSVSRVAVAGQRNDQCRDNRGPGVDFRATLTSTGPTTVKYYWVIDGKRDQTLERQVNGSLDVSWGIGGTHGASETSGSAELVVISPNSASSGSTAYVATCPKPAAAKG